MDLSKLADRAVKTVALRLQDIIPLIAKGCVLARESGCWTIARTKVDAQMQILVDLADSKPDAKVLTQLQSALQFTWRVFTVNHVDADGRARVAAAQFYRAIQHDGTYNNMRDIINGLPSDETSLRKMANDANLLTGLDDPTRYLGAHKLVETQSTVGANVSAVQEEWYLSQAFYLEAIEAANSPEVKARLAVMMLQSYNKAARVTDCTQLVNYVSTPFSGDTSSKLSAALYHRSEATNQLISKVQGLMLAKLGLTSPHWEEPMLIHNPTFDKVMSRSYCYKDLPARVQSETEFKNAIKLLMDYVADGAVLVQPVAIDVTPLYVRGDDTLAATLKRYVDEEKVLYAQTLVVKDAITVEEFEKKLAPALTQLFPFVITDYTPPPAPLLANALAAAEGAPSGTRILPCGKLVPLPKLAPSLTIVGFCQSSKEVYLNPKMDILLLPKVFGGTAEQRWRINNNIIHSGFRIDPLQTKKFWAASKDYLEILQESDIPLTKLSSTSAARPILFADFTLLLAHSSVKTFEKLCASAVPLAKIYATATMSMLKGLGEFKYQPTARLFASVFKSEEDCPYTGTLTLLPGDAKAYEDRLCTVEWALAGAALPANPYEFFVKRPELDKLKITLTLASTNADAEVLRDASAEPFPKLPGTPNPRSGIDLLYESLGLTDLLQTNYFRIANAMANASGKTDQLVPFMNQVEIIHQEILSMLSVMEPHQDDDFQTALLAYLAYDIPAQVHLKPSCMHCLASIATGVEAVAGTQNCKVLFLNDCYYEESFAIGEWRHWEQFRLAGDDCSVNIDSDNLTLADIKLGRKGFDRLAGLQLFVCDFHHNISIDRNHYKAEQIKEYVETLFANNLVASKFTLAIDCTIDLLKSTEAAALLAKFKEKINSGALNVVLFRSAQKFDMLGLDNYYGGYTISLNKAGDWDAYRAFMDTRADQLYGLNRQGLTHIFKYAAPSLDDYREALMQSTKKVYDKLEPACIYQPGSKLPHLMISKIEDERCVFLDAKFPYAQRNRDARVTELLGAGPVSDGMRAVVENTVHKEYEALYQALSTQLQNFASKNAIPITTRASFGFSTSNVTMIAGTKVRLNPGLDSDAVLEDLAKFFNALHANLSNLAPPEDASDYAARLRPIVTAFDASTIQTRPLSQKMTDQQARDAVISHTTYDEARVKPEVEHEDDVPPQLVVAALPDPSIRHPAIESWKE